MQDIDRQKEKMESLGQLAGGVAHELNNMLQPILFAADAIQKRSGDKDAVITASSEKIISCVTRAANIVDDILAFARQDTQRLDFLNVEDVLKKSLLFSIDLIPKTVEVIIEDYPNSNYWAWINETDMIRVISNLLSNASATMNDKGTIDVSISYVFIMSKEVDLYSVDLYEVIEGKLSPGRYACISVKDYGEGIKEEKLRDIFNPFYTSKDIGEGTGLGLSIANNILKGWSGGIEVISKVGAGSEFLLYIPVYRTGEDGYKT